MSDSPTHNQGARLAILLAVFAAAAFLVRSVAIAEPLGIDQSLWASAVRGMSRGQLLYRDVWEQRPPGIYYIYLAGFRLLGWTAATVAWLDIIAAALTTACLYFIARRIAAPLTAAGAAFIYAWFTMPAWLAGHGGFLERSVCETFIVACVAAAAWAAVQYRERPSSTSAFLIGLFCGAAVVLKPNAGLYYPALLLWIALYRPVRPWVNDVRPLLVSVAGTIVLPALTLLWLWNLGLLGDAKVAVLDFNRFYVSEGFSISRYAVDFSKAVFLRMKTDPMWFAGSIGAVIALWQILRERRLPPLAGLAVIWGAAAALVIIVNGARLFNTYFINPLPPLALMSAYLLGEFPRGSRWKSLLAGAAYVVMALLLITRHYPERVFGMAADDFNALRGSLDRTRYLEIFGGYGNNRGYSARANEELATYIREHTAPDDRIFLFGINGAGVYFAADRLTAHRFLRVNFFVATEFPNPAFRLDAVTRELAERRPRYIIFEQLHSASEMGRTADRLPDDPLVAALLAQYHLETRLEDFAVYRLND
ncbi:MAG TPA: glycosyltransferase family 39 protein [Vicinamibacterales bacterium]